MTATDAMVARVRRMVAEPTNTTYSDELLTTYIESYPLVDARGEEPFTWDLSTSPPTKETNDDWVPRYDLNMAAAVIMEEKAAVYAGDFDFRADGGDYKRSQIYQNMLDLARKFRSRRSPKMIKQYSYPPDTSDELTFNVNDPYE